MRIKPQGNSNHPNPYGTSSGLEPQLQPVQQTSTMPYMDLEKEEVSVQETFSTEVVTLENRIAETRQQLANSPEVMRISQQLDVQNKMAVLQFGEEPANEISKYADRILNSTTRSDLEDSSVMLSKLTKVMKQFDSKDFQDNGGFLSKLLNRGKKQIDKLFGKYQVMGKEIDDISVEVEKYRQAMIKTNVNLDQLYEGLFKYYESLEKYIVAGTTVIHELETQDLPHYQRLASSGRQEDILQLQEVQDILTLLKDRVYDLEMAKMAAFQTAPQIRLMQRTNNKLISKIHSAFVVTIPIFKANLIQVIAQKQSGMVNDSLTALSEETNRMLKENAQNTVAQSVLIAQQANQSMISIDVLEDNMNTIMRGLEDVKRIENEKEQLRDEGIKRVHQLQNNYQRLSIENKTI